MRSYRHLRHVLVTMRSGQAVRKDASLKGLMAIYERIGSKEE